MMGVQSGFSVGERSPVYGAISKRVPELVTVADAVKLGGLDYKVELRPLRTAEGLMVPQSKAVVRTDTNKVLGVVGNRYTVLQNERAMDVLSNIVGPDKAVFESAGVLRDGAIAFFVLKLPSIINLPGNDVIEKRFLFYTTHDGSGMTRVKSIPFRMFCANQLNIALSGKGEGIALRHVPSIDDKLKEAERMLSYEERFYRDFEEVARRMLKTKFTDKDMEKFAIELVPSKNGEDDVPPQTVAARNQIIELFSEGAGQRDNRYARGTVWAAFNAVTEFVDHYRRTRTAEQGRREELKTESTWFGSGARLKQAAYTTLLPRLKAA